MTSSSNFHELEKRNALVLKRQCHNLFHYIRIHELGQIYHEWWIACSSKSRTRMKSEIFIFQFLCLKASINFFIAPSICLLLFLYFLEKIPLLSVLLPVVSFVRFYGESSISLFKRLPCRQKCKFAKKKIWQQQGGTRPKKKWKWRIWSKTYLFHYPAILF